MQVPYQKVIRKWHWSDKYQACWRVALTEEEQPLSFELYVGSLSTSAAISFIYIELSNYGEDGRISVKITDWKVPDPYENRGIGSMLLREAILECRHRGVNRITGDLTDADKDHFDKLEYIYEKHGFTVCFFDPDTIERNSNKSKLGEVELTL